MIFSFYGVVVCVITVQEVGVRVCTSDPRKCRGILSEKRHLHTLTRMSPRENGSKAAWFGGFLSVKTDAEIENLILTQAAVFCP